MLRSENVGFLGPLYKPAYKNLAQYIDRRPPTKIRGFILTNQSVSERASNRSCWCKQQEHKSPPFHAACERLGSYQGCRGLALQNEARSPVLTYGRVQLVSATGLPFEAPRRPPSQLLIESRLRLDFRDSLESALLLVCAVGVAFAAASPLDCSCVPGDTRLSPSALA